MEGADGQTIPSISLANRRVDPMIGTLMADRYRILEVLGRGGMGVVYKAKHELMGRLVAIKMLLPTLVSDDVQVARFQREARAASRMNHPNIIGLHDFGLTQDGLPYIVMDYLEGRSLSDVIKESGQVGISRTVHIFVQICDALDHAHRLGIIHRDLKPGNVMLVTNDQDLDFVKVVDFGIAKLTSGCDEDAQRLTSTGEIFGSPVYMSPEQCGGSELDARSDVYALGCVLYETLTGKLPFVGKTIMETITRQIQFDPPSFNVCRPDLYIPEWLENVVFTAVQKDPAKRYQSMEAMRDELLRGYSHFSNVTSTSSQIRALNGALTSRISNSIKVKAVPDPEPAPKQKSKVDALMIGAVALMLGLGCGAAFLLLGKHEPAKKPAADLTRQSKPPTQPATAIHDTKPFELTDGIKPAKPADTRVQVKQPGAEHRSGLNTTATTNGGAPSETPRPKPLPAAETAMSHHESVVAHHKNPPKPAAKTKVQKVTVDDAVVPTTHRSHSRLSGDQWLYQQRVNTEHYGDATPLPMSGQ